MSDPLTLAIAEMGIPRAYRSMRIEEIHGIKPQILTAYYQLALGRKWLIICGNESGIGKTHFAVGMMIQSWKIDLRDPPDFARDRTQIPPPADRYHFFDAQGIGLTFKHCGTLWDEKFLGIVQGRRTILIDEIGREPEAVKEEMEFLLRHCHAAKIQLIATSPLTVAEFRTYYDGAVIRRIDDNGIMIDAVRESDRVTKFIVRQP